MSEELPWSMAQWKELIDEDCEKIREICEVDSPRDREIYDDLRQIYGELEWLTFNHVKKKTRIEAYRDEKL